MPFCENCGFEYLEGNRFCSSCGHRIDAEPITSTENQTSLEEKILWEGKPSGFKARLKGSANLNATTFVLTNLRLIIRTGLLSKKEEQIELIRIKDLELIQGLKDRTLGVGDIRIISTDQDDPEITLAGIKNPGEVKDIIWKAVREERVRHVRYISNA
ncbi:MAG: PH domain-containing protein [Methanotrichaceae archaeon]|jgi:hypothetical protein